MKKMIFLLSAITLFSSCALVSDKTNNSETVYTGTLIITEVGSAYYYNVPTWFELYNNSSSVANLGDYTVSTIGICYTNGSYYLHYNFSLPSITVQPGAYVLIRGKTDPNLPANTSQVVYINNGVYAPYFADHGYVELLKGGQTADFVRYGTNTTSPVTPGTWSGSAPALPYSFTTYGFSIARNGTNLDTDSASDWKLCTNATPGGPNDITNYTDADNDGIPDSCEIPGSTYAGLPLYDWGARTNRKDIFIHVNYMNSVDCGTIPRKEALDKVVAAFAAKGIAIHFDVGSLFASGTSTNNHNLDDQNHQVPFSQTISLGYVAGHGDLYAYKNTYMNIAKRQIFHYMLMANVQDVPYGSSGIAELPGNDFIVSLGQWDLTNAPQPQLNLLINFQASTIMHEFGHNLGLHHGGSVDTNYKPNYYSIMNYMFQLAGLPAIGNNEGDRYYMYQKFYGNLYNSFSYLTNGPFTTNFKMDYSDGSGGNLTETAANETLGLRRTGSSGVDFNGDSSISGTVSYDLNWDGYTDPNPYNDYNDWGNVNLFFQRNWAGDATGVSLYDSKNSPVVWPDKIGDDHQPYIVESLTYQDVKSLIRGDNK